MTLGATADTNANGASEDVSDASIEPNARNAPDREWAQTNLRFSNGEPYLDLANVLRILERHADYQGRFKYNDTLRRVLDGGAVMLDWRVNELCAQMQERFLPGVETTTVDQALVIHANRISAR